ncbi:MAG: phosphate signaling complex protein PhoU [Mycobacteriaceae bacterium]|nr:phosphate signaling complex protein PhoU [Mycobacteriaceae bacterium]
MRTAYQEQLSDLTDRLADACGMSGRAMQRATEALLQTDLSLAETVIVGHEDIATMTGRAEERAFVLLALQAPVAGDLRAIVSSIQIAADIERMGGLAVHVAKIVRMRHPQQAVPPNVREHFAAMGETAVSLAGSARDVLLSRDPCRAAQIRYDDDVMDDMHRQLVEALMDPGWNSGVECAIDVTLLGRFYERFADHTVQIARRVIFQATGEYVDVPNVGKCC